MGGHMHEGSSFSGGGYTLLSRNLASKTSILQPARVHPLGADKGGGYKIHTPLTSSPKYQNHNRTPYTLHAPPPARNKHNSPKKRSKKQLFSKKTTQNRQLNIPLASPSNTVSAKLHKPKLRLTDKQNTRPNQTLH